MKDLDETGFGPEGEAERAGAGPRTRAAFDPLFDDWDDGRFDSPPSWLRRQDNEDFLTWGLPEPATATFGRAYAGTAGWTEAARRTPAYEPAYAAPMSQAQVALREGIITIPRPERRWAAAFFTIWGLVIFSAGLLMSMGALGINPADTKLIWGAALAIGGIWSVYGLAGVAMDWDLPYPSVHAQRDTAETVLLAMLIFLSVRASFQNFRVEGASMSTSLENGEYLIVNKLSYAQVDTSMFDFLPFYDSGDNPVKHLWGGPKRGDVIVFEAPTSPGRDFIKRIIGLPGDTVEITPSGEVLVNGTVLSEDYITGVTGCNGSQCKWEVPAVGTPEAEDMCHAAACYFVMGDNRQNSSDSRQGWLVPEGNIIGKAVITYWKNGELDLQTAPNHEVAASDGTEPSTE